ncbi:MAG: SDR family oxidoreductase [Phaeodactylibacter sp.]|nr:SDR family oxidoreductase [Phaeodactylibacter sp.]MCB9286599.1 SDR family oxidoreductase [Lewinellaceae bacterium]
MENKIALITGGSRGLGKNAALRLAEKGADIILTYRTGETEAKAVVSEIEQMGRKAAALYLDVAEVPTFDGFLEQVAGQLKEKWGRSTFDFLINNAGHGAHGMIGQTSEETFGQLFNVQFKGAYFLTQKALPLIADGGRIVNLSTGLTRFAMPGYSAYAAMKGAMEIVTKYLAKELGSRGITANLVAPGAIDNDFNKQAFDAYPQVKEVIASNTALGRVGVSEDIGGVVAFLCSEDARWVNAQRIEASGGMFL